MMGIEAIVGLVTSIIGRIWPDKSEQQKLQFAKELQQAMIDADLAKGQMEINVEEAKSTNLFVAGWRPFIGWVCGLAFAWQYLVCPLLTFLIVASGHPAPAMPAFGIETMMPVLVGMLGLGGLRTYEKLKGK
jgi:hypothetical protein